MKKMIFGVLSALFVSSCSSVSTGSTVGKKQTSIAGTQWTLVDSVKGKSPTLVLEADKISGNAGCNNYFGELTLDASVGRFSAQNIGSTRMACDQMTTESNFLNMLRQADRYRVNGNVLELYKGSLLLMKFTKM
ncbi:META domain-containing protein [Bergeyella sp. RCAD1439]|uniref:META domain-containing protein n=1 Tax=Bergeyella anatis TaxID=3113737 RepID=UPI002E196D0F|nr:META domain-containing protein [Bergeyella sp. RCAD1439]